jgi:predicted RNA-binding protein YlxR (DUF448 family)
MSRRQPTPAKPSRKHLRQCGICRQYAHAINMAVRLTWIAQATNQPSKLIHNPTGSMPGRSAYCCRIACWQKACLRPQQLTRGKPWLTDNDIVAITQQLAIGTG